MSAKTVSELVRESLKINSKRELLENIDTFCEIVYDDVLHITNSKGLFFSDFDFIFKESCDLTKTTLTKTHLSSVKSFLNDKSIDVSIQWLIRRIISNMRNISLDPRYKGYISISFADIYDSMTPIVADQDFEVLIDELYRLDRLTLLQGLRQVWEDAKEDFDFDEIDFEELCEKFGFSVEEVMGETILLKAEQTAGGNRQLVLFFDPND